MDSYLCACDACVYRSTMAVTSERSARQQAAEVAGDTRNPGSHEMPRVVGGSTPFMPHIAISPAGRPSADEWRPGLSWVNRPDRAPFARGCAQSKPGSSYSSSTPAKWRRRSAAHQATRHSAILACLRVCAHHDTPGRGFFSRFHLGVFGG